MSDGTTAVYCAWQRDKPGVRWFYLKSSWRLALVILRCHEEGNAKDSYQHSFAIHWLLKCTLKLKCSTAKEISFVHPLVEKKVSVLASQMLRCRDAACSPKRFPQILTIIFFCTNDDGGKNVCLKSPPKRLRSHVTLCMNGQYLLVSLVQMNCQSWCNSILHHFSPTPAHIRSLLYFV